MSKKKRKDKKAVKVAKEKDSTKETYGSIKDGEVKLTRSERKKAELLSKALED